MNSGRTIRILFLLPIALWLQFSAAPLLAGASPDTARINSMAREGRELLKDKSKIRQADSILMEASRLVESSNAPYPPLLSWARAELEMVLGDYGMAFKMASGAMKSLAGQIDPKTEAELTLFYARTCQFTGQFQTAIQVLEGNIEMARRNNLKKAIPASYMALADAYTLVKKPAKQQEALEQLLRYANLESDWRMAELACNRLGNLRLNYNPDYSVAKELFNQSLDLAKKAGDSSRIAHSFTSIAWVAYLEKNISRALSYYDSAIRCSMKDYPNTIVANSYGNIGTIYRDLNKNDQAFEAWNKGIKAGLPINDWYNLAWIYADMSSLSAATGDYQKAYEFQSKFKQCSDSLFKQNNNEGMAQARARFDVDSQKSELQLLSLRLKNQRLLLYGFAGFLLLSLVIGLLLLRQAKLNAKRRISEMDQKILEVTQANLRQQMNPHFIFNTLNSIQYYMYKHDKLATNNYLTKFSSLMRKILENSQHTAIPVRDEIDALELYLQLESIRFRDKFDYEITVDEEIDPLMYKIPTMLIQPFVENAICHGLMLRPEKGKVQISLTLSSECLCCVIEDNGIGREASREINLKKQLNHNSLGTRITEDRLKLVSSFYGTSMKIDYTDLKDSEGNATGTRVEIHIPILT